MPGLVQVDFLLQVRKADLALISMKELDFLMNLMERVQSLTIEEDYLVTLKLTSSGVMT